MADFGPFKIIVKNTSKEDKYDADIQTQWYNWTIYLESDPLTALEKNIDYVIYHLHSSFPDPDIKVEQSVPKFKIASRAWGEFTVRIDLFHNNKHKTIEHYLSLSHEIYITTHIIDPTEFK
jgi:transcription initiation factor IIF auxiliary subunit